MRYRRKPVEVECVLWDGTNDAEVREFVGDGMASFHNGSTQRFGYLDGDGGFGVGCAIVKDPDGGFSVVSAAVFAREYEGVRDARS